MARSRRKSPPSQALPAPRTPVDGRGRLSSEGRLILAISLVLAAVTTAIYAPTFVVSYQFIMFDDPMYVFDNIAVLSGLNARSARWAATNPVGNNWHPLTVLSHMLDVELYGTATGGHHFTNVFFHAASAALLFLVLRRMTGALWPSALVAALFAWHPLRVESVAWIAERKDVLSTFFMFVALACYARYAQHHGRLAYLAMLFSFVLGLLSKPMLVTFPFALLLLDIWPLRRVTWMRTSEQRFPTASSWRIVVEKLPLFVLVGVFIATTVWAQTGSMSHLPISIRLQNVVISYGIYVRQMFLPHPLYLPYLFVERTTGVAWTIIAGIALLATTLVALWQFRRRPYLAVGWFWYLGTLVPVIGIVQVGEQAHADRYTYVPMIGLYVMLAWLLQELAARGLVWRRAVLSVSGAALCVLIALSIVQVSYWRNNDTLFEHTLRYSPRNNVAYAALAAAAYRRNDYEDAIRLAQQSIEAVPASHLSYSTMAVIAQSLARLGKTGEALNAYQKAIALNPEQALIISEFARILATCDDERFRNGPEAVRAARLANLQGQNQNPILLDTLAAAYAEIGAFEKAIETATTARSLAAHYRAEGAFDDDRVIRGIDQRLAFYRQRQPYRVPKGVWEY
ncbi:MAG: glycosyltransferase family 39 protein [Pirellulales bacterium]|nr:glycosyltransferase family 39 protein [Pirellulales bacterium]